MSRCTGCSKVSHPFLAPKQLILWKTIVCQIHNTIRSMTTGVYYTESKYLHERPEEATSAARKIHPKTCPQRCASNLCRAPTRPIHPKRARTHTQPRTIRGKPVLPAWIYPSVPKSLASGQWAGSHKPLHTILYREILRPQEWRIHIPTLIQIAQLLTSP